MKQFVTILALTAATTFAARCRLECDAPFMVDADCTACVCSSACGENQTQDAATCECADPEPVCEEVCGERLTLNEEDCACEPAEGEDPCDPFYEGAFTDAEGGECPAAEEAEAGAMTLASAAFAIAATLLF